MTTVQIKKQKKKILFWRRLLQTVVLLALIAIPFYSQNPVDDWSPSRIVQGNLPPPDIFPVSGNTWSLTVYDFNISHPVAFIETWVMAKVIYLPLLAAILIPLAITLLLGRVFCSWLCPVGFLLELNMKIKALLSKIGLHYAIKIPDFRYVILVLCLFLSFFLAMPIISIFDPPHMFSRELMYLFTHHKLSMMGVGLLLSILLFELFFGSRVCCRSLCPSGGALSLLGSKRLLRINLTRESCSNCGDCNQVCPYHLTPMNLADGGSFDWTKCDNCGLCRDICPNGAIEYRFGMYKDKQ